MIVLGNSESWPGIGTTADHLQNGVHGLDALVPGLSLVEAETKVRSVGYGGWPNLLGHMEFDASVMDGTTRDYGAVAGVPMTLDVTRLARAVLDNLPHTMLVGEGARRYADELGFERDPALLAHSKEVWWRKLEEVMSDEQKAAFPNTDLAPLTKAITDPEKVRDTTVFLCKDAQNNICTGTSTSGWAWKYPGRVGDAPIPGAGFYADSRYGAAACTHTGEMTMRCGTARTIVLALKLGLSLDDALRLALSELQELESGYIGGVVIHAIDAAGRHRVVNLGCDEEIVYWVWTPELSKPEKRKAIPAEDLIAGQVEALS